MSHPRRPVEALGLRFTVPGLPREALPSDHPDEALAKDVVDDALGGVFR